MTARSTIEAANREIATTNYIRGQIRTQRPLDVRGDYTLLELRELNYSAVFGIQMHGQPRAAE